MQIEAFAVRIYDSCCLATIHFTMTQNDATRDHGAFIRKQKLLVTFPLSDFLYGKLISIWSA